MRKRYLIWYLEIQAINTILKYDVAKFSKVFQIISSNYLLLRTRLWVSLENLGGYGDILWLMRMYWGGHMGVLFANPHNGPPRLTSLAADISLVVRAVLEGENNVALITCRNTLLPYSNTLSCCPLTPDKLHLHLMWPTTKININYH